MASKTPAALKTEITNALAAGVETLTPDALKALLTDIVDSFPAGGGGAAPTVKTSTTLEYPRRGTGHAGDITFTPNDGHVYYNTVNDGWVVNYTNVAPFVPNKTYENGEIAYYHGRLWRCTVSITSNWSGTSIETSDWAPLSHGPIEYDSNDGYVVGDIVYDATFFPGKQYICIKDDPGGNSPGAASTYWAEFPR